MESMSETPATVMEAIDLVVENGHSLYDMPMHYGKRLGDLTKEELAQKALREDDAAYLARVIAWATGPAN